MIFLIFRGFALWLSLLLAVGGVLAQEMTMTTKAKQALLVDGETGSVLFSKNSGEIFHPASMIKLLVAEVVFDALARGEVSPDTLFKVSEQAWRKGGAPSRTTTMFASLNSLIRIDDLLRGLTVVQGNDAALILAEGLAGSEVAFVQRMNERAQALGLTSMHIVDVTGLSSRSKEANLSENRATAQDLIKLARHIEQTYPHYFQLYGEPAFEWNKIFQRNRNPLYQLEMGADGFVTGGIEGEGYGLVATIKQGKRRLFLVLGGLEKEKQRVSEAKKLFEWGMSAFETKLLYDAGVEVAQAKVYGGQASYVALKTTKPVGIVMPKADPPRLKIRAIYRGPLSAPVESEKVVGHLVIASHEGELLEVPLVTASSVAEANFTKKATDALFEISIGWLRKYLTL